jgi:hypothetical protein
MRIDRRRSIINRVRDTSLYRGDRRGHFLHIPKCGGTTIRYIVEAAAGLMDLPVYNEAGAFREAKIGADPVFSMSHQSPDDLFNRVDTAYFTVLRDPATRVYSLLSHLARRQALGPEHHDRLMDDMTDHDLNHATCLLGQSDGHANLDVLLERAKVRLARDVLFFGFQDRLDEFSALLACFLGLEGIIFPVFQIGEARHPLTAKNETRLTQATRHDAELITFARALYQERFGGLFEDASFRVPRRRVPYISISVDPMTSTVHQEQIVFA